MQTGRIYIDNFFLPASSTIFQLGILKTQEDKIRLAVLASKNYDSGWKGVLGHAVKEFFFFLSIFL